MQLNLTDSDIARYWAKVDRRGSEDCWPWTGAVRKDGPYGLLAMKGRYKLYNELAHRIAKYLDDGDVPAGKMALHRCEDNLCQNPAHIFWGTVKDFVYKPPVYRGEAHPRAKLTAEDVREIRTLGGKGLTAYAIAKLKCVDPANVRRILTGQAWRSAV